MNSVAKYPLSWPRGWKRTGEYNRMSARFTSMSGGYRQDITIDKARKRLTDELLRLGAPDFLLSSNMIVGKMGSILSDQKAPIDPGVAVYFTLDGKDRVLACDHWNKVAGNIAAIAAHIAAIRAVDRYCVGSVDQAFAGYEALPEPGNHAKRKWWQVLGCDPSSSKAEIETRYRLLARQHHPDSGGTHAMMAELNGAMADARKDIAA